MNEQGDILVIGAGISGLTVAWKLHQAGRNVRVIDANDTVGGCMRSERRDGYILEKGPFNVMVRDEAFESLLEDFSQDVRVVAANKKAGRRRFILRGDRLLEVPSNPVTLMTSPLLSVRARLRLLRGLLYSAPGDANDSIDDAAARRLGPEFAETLVSAMVSGIVAGDSRRLHFQSCFPNLARIDSQVRSPIGFGLRRAIGGRKTKHQRKWPGLISFENGLGALPEAIAHRLGSRVTTNAAVDVIEPDAAGYTAYFRHWNLPQTIHCRQIVLATSHAATAALLRGIEPEAANVVGTIDAASLVVLNLGYEATRCGHPMEGYGFLVPRSEEDSPLLGVLFADSVFPHHAPDGRRLVRVFLGGPRDPDAATRSERDLLALARPPLQRILGLASEPDLVDVCRWHHAVPQYERGHGAKLERLETLLQGHPGVHLAGNFVGGVSVNDCIGSAVRLAESVQLQAASPMERDRPGRLEPRPVRPALRPEGVSR